MKKTFSDNRTRVNKVVALLLAQVFVLSTGPWSYADILRRNAVDSTTLAPQVSISDERVHALLHDHMQTLQEQLNSGVADLNAPRTNSAVEITFTHYAPGAQRVDVLGDFNNWKTAENTVMTKDKNGVWKLTMTLPRGVNYQYKFLEDNAYWIQDRNNSNRNVGINGDGIQFINSVVTDSDAGVRNNVTVDFYIENAEAVYFLNDVQGWEAGPETAMSPVSGSNVWIKNSSAIYEGMQYKFLVVTKDPAGSRVRTWYFDQQNSAKASNADAAGNIVQNSLMTTERIADFRLYYERQKSRLLTNLMQNAANRGDISLVNKALEKTRVSGLPGRKQDQPFLLIVGGGKESPVRVDFTKESFDSIRYTLRYYVKQLFNKKDIEITDEEIRKLINKETFKINSDATEKKLELLFEAALASGMLGTQYVITNIKRFSDDSFLAYTQFLQKITDKYNGNLVIFLSVEESPAVLGGDGAGMATAVQAVETVLGREFLQQNTINIITDGGEKTRAANWTARFFHNGAMPTPFGETYYERALKTLAKVRFQHKNFGEGRIYWTASDGDYTIGDLRYGQNREADLENDGTWSMIIHGPKAKVFNFDEMEYVRSKVHELFKTVEGIRDEKRKSDKLTQALAEMQKNDPEVMGRIMAAIANQKLTALGENFSNSATGRLLYFREKPSAADILKMLTEFNAEEIIPNAFLVVYTNDAFFEQLDYYYTLINGQRLGAFGGSYFQGVIESQFNKSALEKFPEAIRANLGLIGEKTFPFEKGKIIAAGVKNFVDRGNQDLMYRAYADYCNYIRETQGSGMAIDNNSEVGDNVKITVAPGATVVLQNTRLKAKKPVEIHFSGNAMLQDSTIDFQEDATVPANLVITKSVIEVPLHFFAKEPGNTVVAGITFKNRQTMLDLSHEGQWENVSALEIYTGETVVGLVRTDSQRFINRVLTNSDFKGRSVAAHFADENSFQRAVRNHPRLLGIPRISDWATAQKTEFLSMLNYFGGTDVRGVPIKEAKESFASRRAFYEAGLTLLAPIDTLMLRRGLSFLRQAASSSDEDFYGMDELSPESALKANDLRTLELIGEAI